MVDNRTCNTCGPWNVPLIRAFDLYNEQQSGFLVLLDPIPYCIGNYLHYY